MTQPRDRVTVLDPESGLETNEEEGFIQPFRDFGDLSDEECHPEIEPIAASESETVTDIGMTHRGSGFCENVACFRYGKGHFLFRHEGEFICPACGQQGTLVPDRGIPLRNPGEVFAEVRVEYCYDPASKRFTETAILRDEAWAREHGTYTLQSALITTQKRALLVAEKLLYTLNESSVLDEDLITPPLSQERILDLSKPMSDLRQDLEQLKTCLQKNRFLLADQ